MRRFLVNWNINIDADTPEQAVGEALSIQRDHASLATFFHVTETKEGEKHYLGMFNADTPDVTIQNEAGLSLSPSLPRKENNPMSIQSWKAEFYTPDAATAAKQGPVSAAIHSLNKWRGLLPDNLSKHNLIRVGPGNYVEKDDSSLSHGVITLGSDTCALCCHYSRKSASPDCDRCPLYEAYHQVLDLDYSQCRCNRIGNPYIQHLDEPDSDAIYNMIRSLTRAVIIAQQRSWRDKQAEEQELIDAFNSGANYERDTARRLCDF